MNDPQDFAVFVAGLPTSVQADVATSEVCSTAFYTARRAGWSTDQLVGDACAAIRKSGVGHMVNRLRGLSRSQAPAVQPRPAWHDQPTNRLSAQQARERMALVMSCGGKTPEEAEQDMRDLMDAQRTVTYLSAGLT